MPEAAALAVWLAENVAAFGPPESAVPDDDSGRSRRRGVTVTDWSKVGTALERATCGPPAAARARSIAGLLHSGGARHSTRWRRASWRWRFTTGLDQRVEGLCDAISECRGRPTRFMRDAGLIALLLAAPQAAVASRLTGEAKLLASGVLHPSSHADLSELERLISLIRRDEPPAADIYDQLLGTTTSAPLDWEAFAHLGHEADVATGVLRAALAGVTRSARPRGRTMAKEQIPANFSLTDADCRRDRSVLN
jgi:hypothetical protein